jgi:hypothetical protein
MHSCSVLHSVPCDPSQKNHNVLGHNKDSQLYRSRESHAKLLSAYFTMLNQVPKFLAAKMTWWDHNESARMQEDSNIKDAGTTQMAKLNIW